MPTQRRPPIGTDPPAWRSYVRFIEPDSGDFVVRDINPGDGQSWTRDHPEMRFWVPARAGLRFTVSIWMVDATLKDTGPVTVTVKINGHLLGSMHCTHSGNYRLNELVPLDWLQVGQPADVLVEANPLWTAPDGSHLGYLIDEAGFK